MSCPHKGVSTQCTNQQVLVKPRHQPLERDQQARERLKQKARIKSHAYIQLGEKVLQTVHQTFEPDIPVILHLPALANTTIDTDTVPLLYVIHQQMYEAIKRYETYVAHNKRLEGNGASSSSSQQKAAGHTLGYKPRFHKTTAFTATIPEAEDDGPVHHESSSQEGADAYGDESSQEDDKGLLIPSYLGEALPDDPVLQVKMACAMRAQEVETWRCFTCNQQGHLQRDHLKYEEKNGNRPLQLKGPPLNKSAQERVKTKPPLPGQGVSQTNPPK